MAGILKELTDLPSTTEVTDGLGDFMLIKQGDVDRRIRLRDIFKFHTERVDNPHDTTKDQVALGKINNWEETIDYTYPDDDKYANIGAVRRLFESLDSAIESAVPSGMVMMWSGSIASIPSGYALCDGSNGTPNLLDRFLVGAGSSYSVGSAGGIKTSTHKHNAWTGSTVLTIAQMPSHNHELTICNDAQELPRYRRSSAGPGESEYRPYSTYTEYAGSGDGHTHTADTGDTSLDNRPPYYALAFIMKL